MNPFVGVVRTNLNAFSQDYQNIAFTFFAHHPMVQMEINKKKIEA
jgi:hypothetical protein